MSDCTIMYIQILSMTLCMCCQVALADWVDSSQGAYHCTDLADSDIDILQASQQVKRPLLAIFVEPQSEEHIVN